MSVLIVSEDALTMTPAQQVAKALEIAFHAHNGQFEMDGRPYLFHPMRLASRAATDDQRIVALLHDTVEDTDVTLEGLRAAGFPEHVVTAVDHMTKREGEDYDAFVERALQDPIAARVKLLDIEDNMDLTRIPEVAEKDLARAAKYHRARRRILEALS